jgi:competence protein ComEC
MRRFVIAIVIAFSAAAGIYIGYIRSGQVYPRPTGPTISIAFLDARHGGGTVVRTPEGRWTVIDPGPSAEGRRLVEYLKTAGAQVIDVVVTNPNRLRCGALGELMDSFKVRRFVRGAQEGQSRAWQAVLREVESRGLKEQVVAGGDVVGVSPTTRMAVLNPPAKPSEGDRLSADDSSLVLQIRFGEKRVLLTSDIGAVAESHLIKLGQVVESDILWAAHFGRYGSNSLELISAVRPACCILTCGGRLGNPSAGVLARIDPKNSGADLYRTDKDGTILVISDGLRTTVDVHADGN